MLYHVVLDPNPLPEVLPTKGTFFWKKNNKISNTPQNFLMFQVCLIQSYLLTLLNLETLRFQTGFRKLCVCVCVRACVHACVCACVCVIGGRR